MKLYKICATLLFLGFLIILILLPFIIANEFYFSVLSIIFAPEQKVDENNHSTASSEQLKLHLKTNIESIINVKEYGAIGDGISDDTNSIQRAINAAKEGQTVYFPCAQYVIGSLNLKSGIIYDFGNSELICISDTPLTAQGEEKFVTTISNYSALDKTVTLGDVNGVEKGDFLHLVAFEDSFNTFRRYYYKGGTTPILGISTDKSKVEIAEPFLFNIKAQGTRVKIVKPWKGKILNIKNAVFKRLGTLKYFIQLEYAYLTEIKNVTCFMEDGYNIINLKCCCLCTLDSCKLYKTKVHSVGYSYNVLCVACTGCTIKNCDMKTMWHCYTNGGSEGCTVGTVIDNCTMLTDGKVPACTDHNNAINTGIYNSTIEGFVLSCGGSIKNCVLLEPHNFPYTAGACFQFNAQHHNWLYNNYTVEDCTVYRSRKQTDGHVFGIKNAETTRKQNRTNKNRVYINNITISRCIAPDSEICKFKGNKHHNIDVKQIIIENCRNIVADFFESQTSFDLGNRINSVIIRNNNYKDRIAFFHTDYVQDILIENCRIDNAEKDINIIEIFGSENVTLRNIKGFGQPVDLNINIGAQGYVIGNLVVENVDTQFANRKPGLKVSISNAAVIEKSYIK